MKIKLIKSVGYEPVYNMEVDRFHNFAVNGGVIVHNCDAIRYFLAGRPARAFEQTLPQDFCYENDPDGGLRRGYVEGGWYD